MRGKTFKKLILPLLVAGLPLEISALAYGSANVTSEYTSTATPENIQVATTTSATITRENANNKYCIDNNYKYSFILDKSKKDTGTEKALSNYVINTFENGTAAIISYNGNDESLIIPNKIDNYYITQIYDNAFKNTTNLKSIKLPDNLEYIDENAFVECTKLTELSIENSDKFMCLDGVLFSKDGRHLIKYPINKSTTNYSVPKNVISINNNAFNNCHIESITCNNDIINIGDGTFTNCTNLKSVTLSDSLKYIGKNVFKDCTSLQNIVIPKNVSLIGSNTFENCSSLESCVFNTNELEIIEDNLFLNCKSLKNLVLPAKTIFICPYAFKNCSSLESMTIPKYVGMNFDDNGDLDLNIISGCDNLKKLTLLTPSESLNNYSMFGIEATEESNTRAVSTRGIAYRSYQQLCRHPQVASIDSLTGNIHNYGTETYDTSNLAIVGLLLFSGLFSITILKKQFRSR